MTRDLTTAVLIEGLDDWVPLRTVESIARRLEPARGETWRHELVTRTIGRMLERGYVEAGTVSDQHGYAVLDESIPDILERIRTAFVDPDPNMWGYSIWLNNTQTGDALAQQAESSPER